MIITEIIPDDIPEWAKDAMDRGQLFNEMVQREIIYQLPWWLKDRKGWPIELVKDKWVQNILRICCMNIKKLAG